MNWLGNHCCEFIQRKREKILKMNEELTDRQPEWKDGKFCFKIKQMLHFFETSPTSYSTVVHLQQSVWAGIDGSGNIVPEIMNVRRGGKFCCHHWSCHFNMMSALSWCCEVLECLDTQRQIEVWWWPQFGKSRDEQASDLEVLWTWKQNGLIDKSDIPEKQITCCAKVSKIGQCFLRPGSMWIEMVFKTVFVPISQLMNCRKPYKWNNTSKPGQFVNYNRL